MMPAIDQAILAISNSLAASIIVKATVVISLALITARLARSSRASVRHAILTAGFAVLFALPIAAIVAPPIHIALPIAQNSSAPAADAPQSAGETQSARQTSKDTAFLSTKSETRESSLVELLFAAWAIGAALFLAPVIIGLWQVRSLRRTGLPWSRSSSLAAALANKAGLRRGIEVLLHESVAVPMTCGVLRPAVLFPVEAENWNDDDLHRTSAHELEHVRRADWITHCLARIVCAAYWFHPLVWIAWRRLTLEAERACDDAVLSRSEATAYAEQLVALARQLRTAKKFPVLAMANRSDLTARIHAVLDARQPRGRTGLFAVAFACGGAALVIVTLSPIRLVAAQPHGQDQQANGAPWPSFEVASIKHVPGPWRPHIIFDGVDPSRYTTTNTTAKWLIELAYDIKDFQISGGPSWINSEGFDIDAKIDDATANQIRHLSHDEQEARKDLMLRSLLTDRFNLKITRGTKDLPVFAIVVAKGGSKITKVPPPPPLGTSPTPASPPAHSSDGLFPLLPGQRDISSSQDRVHTIVRGNAEPLSQLASMLSLVLGQPVLDQTGMTGTYDFKLQFAAETGIGGAPPPPGAQSGAEAAPSLFSAIQEQLGLRLESTKAPVETIVIDHIDEPSEN